MSGQPEEVAVGAAWTLTGYGVERLLGFGATGEVWRAHELASGDVVALKRLRPGAAGARDLLAQERLGREAALLAAVRHPHVLPLRSPDMRLGSAADQPGELSTGQAWLSPAGSRSRGATTVSTSRSGTRASALGHQTRDPMSKVRAGTSTERTTSVSSSTPKATTKPTSAKATRGSTPSTENVPASTMPAEVITPPVTASPRSIPRRVPTTAASSRTRLIRKML